MRVLITGNLGYVGSLLTRAMAADPRIEALVGLDAGWFAGCLTDPEASPDSRLEQRQDDVRHLPAGTFRGIDAVVHLAAVSNDPIGNKFGDATLAINGQASGKVAAQAKHEGVKRFVFASSCSLYGAAGNTARKEDDALSPLTAYAHGKAQAEAALRELASPGFHVHALRFATACGWTPRFRSDLVLNDFVLTALDTGEIRVLSDGSPWRPLIHVADMARAIIWAVAHDPSGDAPWNVFNVGHPEMNVRVGDLAERVAARLPGTRVSINTNAAPDKRSYSVDFSRLAAAAPEAMPRVDLDAAIDDLAVNLRGYLGAFAPGERPETARLRTLEKHLRDGILDENLRRTAA